MKIQCLGRNWLNWKYLFISGLYFGHKNKLLAFNVAKYQENAY